MILRVFNKDLPIRNLLFVVGEGLLIYVAVLIATFLRSGAHSPAFFAAHSLGKALLITVVCQACLYYNDLYNPKVTDTYLELGLRMAKALGVASIILALVYYCVPSLLIGRGVFFVSLIFLVLLLVPWRYGYSWILKKRMFTENVMILGSGELCRQIADEINGRADSGYRVAGIVSTNPNIQTGYRDGVPLLALNCPLSAIADEFRTKKIIVAMDEKRGKFPTEALLRCRVQGISIVEGESLYEELTGKIFLEKLNPSWLIFSAGFRKSRIARLLKRIIGLAMASAGLLFTAPLFGLIALAIKLDSKGPVFFKQNRCGENDRVFALYKFRSMIDNAEASSGPTWATDDDWRVTRMGRILRKYRMDELPQLWNVVKGDMSFVGPRPERPEFVEKLAEKIPYYSERHTVKPGITGWAQVCYRYGASMEDAFEKLKYDLFYVKNLTLALDLLIIFRTIKIVLLQSGAR